MFLLVLERARTSDMVAGAVLAVSVGVVTVTTAPAAVAATPFPGRAVAPQAAG